MSMPAVLKLNKARHEVIVEAVRQGNYMGTAARLARINPTTLHAWLRKGAHASENEIDYDTPEGAYRKLYEEVEYAAADFEAAMVSQVRRAALDEDPKHWTAAMTILERTRPEKFGRHDKQTLEVSSPVAAVAAQLSRNPEAMTAANDLIRALSGVTGNIIEGVVVEVQDD